METKNLESIPIAMIDDNPFNSRIDYRKADLITLAASLKESGQLVPIKVRPRGGRFEIIYGHRRVKSARLLHWDTIKGEVESVSDEQMIRLSLIENLNRRDISDYEKALCFAKMRADFNMTFEGIGKLVGLSKPYVSNLVRMTGLVDEETLAHDPLIRDCMLKISEHHARVLLEIQDRGQRSEMLIFTAREELSVRDLERIVHKLRSWFKPDMNSGDGSLSKVSESEEILFNEKLDIEEIKRILWAAECDLPHKKDFDQFEKMHAFKEGFSMYDDTPPYVRLKDSAAMRKKKDWFYSLAPNYYSSLRDVDVKVYADLALATMYVDYHKPGNSTDDIQMIIRGSVILLRRGDSWKILHEHWSRLDDIPGNTSNPNTLVKHQTSHGT